MKYENGKIYKIESDQTDKVYIGSTTQPLSHRMRSHRAKYKIYLEGTYHFVTSFDILKFGDAKIFLIENYPCSNKEELEARERHYIKTTNCVNKCQPGRTYKEYYEDHKEAIIRASKEYRQANQDKIKAYRESHREANNKHKKKYIQTNKEIIKQKAHDYNVKRVVCECGMELSQGSLYRHVKTKFHTDAMAKLN